MDAPVATHTMTHPTSIVVPHPTLITSTTDITYITIQHTGASLTLATPTALHRNHNQEKHRHVQDLHS